MKDHLFARKDLVSAVNYLTEFKRACYFSKVYDWATVKIFGDFIAGPAIPAIKERLALSSKDANNVRKFSEYKTQSWRRF